MTDSYQKPAPRNAGMIVVLVIICGALAILFAMGLIPKLLEKQELKKVHEETSAAVPIVHTVVAKPAKAQESVTLPGNIGAIQYTTIYARVDGYLKSRLVDIGDNVKTGQLLAEIETPTVDEHLNQVKADLDEAISKVLATKAQLKQAIADDFKAKAEIERAKANQTYASVTATRWKDMCVRGAVSEQSRDEKVRSFEATSADVNASIAAEKAALAQVAADKSNVVTAQAAVVAKKADVRRLQYEQGFQKVLAPFDGVITARKVDPGALITQGSQSSNLELYQMAKIDRLRIYVSVPQRVARYLHNGLEADILVSEYPDRHFRGLVTNVSGALDPSTRTRQTEIKIDNPSHVLLPGMYAEVRLTGLRDSPWIRVPGTTIVAKPDGQFVVVIKDGHVHFQAVDIGRDFGDEVEIRTGLQGNEVVVVSPSDDLRENDPVKTDALPQNST